MSIVGINISLALIMLFAALWCQWLGLKRNGEGVQAFGWVLMFAAIGFAVAANHLTACR